MKLSPVRSKFFFFGSCRYLYIKVAFANHLVSSEVDMLQNISPPPPDTKAALDRPDETVCRVVLVCSVVSAESTHASAAATQYPHTWPRAVTP